MRTLLAGIVVVGAMLLAQALAAATILVLGRAVIGLELTDDMLAWFIVTAAGVTVAVCALIMPLAYLSRPPRQQPRGSAHG